MGNGWVLLVDDTIPHNADIAVDCVGRFVHHNRWSGASTLSRVMAQHQLMMRHGADIVSHHECR